MVLFNSINSSLPRISYLKAVDYFLVTGLTLIASCMAEYMFVLNIPNKTDGQENVDSSDKQVNPRTPAKPNQFDQFLVAEKRCPKSHFRPHSHKTLRAVCTPAAAVGTGRRVRTPVTNPFTAPLTHFFSKGWENVRFEFGVKGSTLSLPRVINVKFPLQPRQ